jgi:hypothetical protein
MEKSAYTQHSGSGSYIPLVKTVAKEGVNISGNVNFQISPNGTLSVYYLYNAYLKFEVEREFVYTTDTQLTQATTVFLGDKHTADFFNQVHICSHDTLIVDNLDVIEEINILGATYADEMKRKHPMTYTCASAVNEKFQDICGIYLDMNNVAIGSTIRFAYEVIIQMTTFNIFADI